VGLGDRRELAAPAPFGKFSHLDRYANDDDERGPNHGTFSFHRHDTLQ